MRDNQLLAIIIFITMIASILCYFETKKINKAYEQRQLLNIIRNTYSL